MKQNLFTRFVSGFFLTTLLPGFCGFAFAQSPAPDILWEKPYGVPICPFQYGEGFYDIQATDDGHYILAGNYCTPATGGDIMLVKLDDTAGDFLWTQTYGGSLDDQGLAVQQTSDGGYIVTGATKSYGAGNWDVFLLKMDANGDSLWMKTYGGTRSDGSWAVFQTADGGYFIAASTESYGAGASDIWLLRTDADGDTLWTKTYGGTGHDAIWPEDLKWTLVKARPTPVDGGCIIATFSNSFGDGDYDMWLLKTDADGDTLWTKFYGGPEDELGHFMDIRVTLDGGYIVAGSTYSYGVGTPAENNVYLVKTDEKGDIQWTKTYGGLEEDEGFVVQQTTDGGYILSTYSYSYGAGGSDIYLIRTDENGDIRWTKAIGGASNEAGRILIQTADGGYIAGGSTHSYGAGQADAYVVKLAKEPTLTFIDVPEDQPTIQAGINAAKDGDIVLVDDGTYYENINFKGKAITVASRYFTDGDTSHIANTIIDGSRPSHPDSGSVVYFVSGEDTTSFLYGFTITNGTGTIGTGLTFDNRFFIGRVGGGVCCYKSGASILFNHIINNSAIGTQDEAGGGISAYPDDYRDVFYVIIKGNRILNNTVVGGSTASGGGIGMFCDGKVINNTIAFNSCEAKTYWACGGGVQCVSDPNDATPTEVEFLNNTIVNNSSTTINDAAYGGGLFIRHTATHMWNNQICHNEIKAGGTFEAFGAGLTIWSVDGKTILDANRINHNSVSGGTGKGGGLSLGHDASPLLTNNIISDNTARSSIGWGGGIYIDEESYAIVINNTITDNVALFGGGFYLLSDASVILNSIVWGNAAEIDAGIRDMSNTNVVAYSDIQGGWDGENNIDTDPLVEDDTFHLSDHSHCIGTGIASIDIDGVTYICPGKDHDGRPRPRPTGSKPDIGAFESRLANPINIVHCDENSPITFSLSQNYPNPFNPSTTIAYDLPSAGFVCLIIYDVLGRHIKTVVNQQQKAGHLQTTWDGTDECGIPVAGGVYFCRMQAVDFTKVIKLTLVR